MDLISLSSLIFSVMVLCTKGESVPSFRNVISSCSHFSDSHTVSSSPKLKFFLSKNIASSHFSDSLRRRVDLSAVNHRSFRSLNDKAFSSLRFNISVISYFFVSSVESKPTFSATPTLLITVMYVYFPFWLLTS